MDVDIFIKNMEYLKHLIILNFIKSFEMDKRDSSVYTTFRDLVPSATKVSCCNAFLSCVFLQVFLRVDAKIE